MFLDLLQKRNPNLVKTAFDLHRDGLIEPDTYVLDMDALQYNGKTIKEEADKYGIKLYIMTKQFGRNPYVAAELMKLGYDGAVAVEYREAELLYQNGIKLGHVGHLVQVPANLIERVLSMKPEVITVYSLEKAYEISKAARKMNVTQKIMLRIIDENDIILPGQNGGISTKELLETASIILDMPNIELHGLTSFPCFLVDEDRNKISETHNASTIVQSKSLLEAHFGIKLNQLNMPSVTCSSSIKKIAEMGGTHGEPGHGLLGTTPIHALSDQMEIPAIIYVSEISHNFDHMSYCYGGGYYRRSHMRGALVGKDMKSAERIDVKTPDSYAIDYYIGLKRHARVGDTAVFSFRTQIFVTRSKVAVVRGISEGKPQILGIYDSLGGLVKKVQD